MPIQSLKTLKSLVPEAYISVDNPGSSWLQHERIRAQQHDSAFGLRSGSVTCVVQNIELPTDFVLTLDGMLEEHTRIREDNVREIQESMQRIGFQPSKAIFLNVGFDGRTLINEGNHRLRAAKATGLSSVPVSISYFAGGEAVDGPLAPATLLGLVFNSRSCQKEITRPNRKR